MVTCIHCGAEVINTSQYCSSCGKLHTIHLRKNYPKFISLDQILWITIGAWSIYIIVRYLLNRFQQIPSQLMLSSLIMGLILSFRIISLYKTSNLESINDFFPGYKLFLLLNGMAIMIVEIFFVIDFDLQNIDIIVIFFEIIFQLFEGFSFGVITPFFIFFFKVFKKS